MSTEPTAAERIEDVAFQNRIRTLTRDQKWAELEAVFLVYGSALSERETTPDCWPSHDR